jgi:hypothetical protein
LAINAYISGGKYSGVLLANYCWCSTTCPSGFNKKLEPRSIIFREMIFYARSSKSTITFSGFRSACTIPILERSPIA